MARPESACGVLAIFQLVRRLASTPPSFIVRRNVRRCC
jgi:hypothetical protein